MESVERMTRVPGLPRRPEDGHKGSFGRVLVVGGSPTMLGAPMLAAMAALRSGSGLVQVAMPRPMLAAALSVAPEVIGLALGADGGGRELAAEVQRADAVVLGPGLGQSAESKRRVKALWPVDRPMLVDADALNILAEIKRWPVRKGPAVLTPHPGEMARLVRRHLHGATVPADEAGRAALAVQAARAWRCVLVLKGHRTVVSDGQRVYVNQSGDSTLAKAGSGDVLAGMIGSFVGQGMEAMEAACLGVYLHGRSGELAGRRLGRRCALARDVIESIPGAIGELEQAG
jgi:NAD(P)H-hydrate epimerase